MNDSWNQEDVGNLLHFVRERGGEVSNVTLTFNGGIEAAIAPPANAEAGWVRNVLEAFGKVRLEQREGEAV